MKTYTRNRQGQFRHKPQMSGLYLLAAISISTAGLNFGAKAVNEINRRNELSQVCKELVSPLPKTPAFEIVEATVEAKPVVIVENTCKNDSCKAVEYFKEKFGNRAEDGLKMLKQCENRQLSTSIVSPMNVQKSGRKSYDVGFMQINADASDTVEIEKLKDFKYNIDKGYAKFKAHNNTFYLWTCGHVAGDKTYADNFRKK